jgi:2-keto-4-pentenoate hydratase/2-oxohepta-3-ene-1,7-dioic acid hydratase in catechol pathway
VTKYVRFRRDGTTGYGILDGETIRELRGGLFDDREETDTRHGIAEVKLLYPCEPATVFAVGRNYKSHLGGRAEPSRPEIFFMPVTALQNPEDPIILPPTASNVHPEGELVIVIGKRVRGISPADAEQAIFGVTCGNDVSERDWQNGSEKDLQWWRAKGSDTFAPLGPAIVTGIDYSNLMLQTRVNGEVKQKQSTADLIFDCPTIVSWISQSVTLGPGDVIYTGTPGSTSKMHRGDVVEVEIENIGVLRNRVE